jgi:dipeptidyl aminopeptidase/acylaminoacyl peptidase
VRSALAVALVLAACSKHDEPAPAPKPAAVQTDEARVRDFVGKLTRHELGAVLAMCDDKVRGALPEAKLSESWTKAEQTFGAFEKIESIELHDRVALAKLKFASQPAELHIVFDADGKVGSFNIKLGDTAASWQPPPYAKQGAFEEREVKVGQLPGTLTIPRGATHYPVLVLVHGSGPNDRDETIGVLKPFKDLAYGLASRGVAVLRYEKRTHVNPIGVRTQKEEVDDAAHEAIALVRALPDVDPERVALLGHSQGGYLAPRIARDDPKIKRLVILAGPIRSLPDAMLAQVKYMGGTPDQIAQLEKFKAAVENPKLAPDDEVDVPFSSPITGAYFLEVRDYHPEQVAAKLTIPLLLLQGERDYQVTVADDFVVWKKAVAGVKTATLRTYPGLNHAFTHGEGAPGPLDYRVPGHVDAQVVEDLATWLNAK